MHSQEIVLRYVTALQEKFLSGHAREHTYRPVLESFINALDEALKVFNEPPRSEHGNPDFVFFARWSHYWLCRN
jgi:hypothetical protein